jgi:hypothetical protein
MQDDGEALASYRRVLNGLKHIAATVGRQHGGISFQLLNREKKCRWPLTATASVPEAKSEDEEQEAPMYGWRRFRSVKLEHDQTEVEWESGEITPVPALNFLDQIGLHSAVSVAGGAWADGGETGQRMSKITRREEGHIDGGGSEQEATTHRTWRPGIDSRTVCGCRPSRSYSEQGEVALVPGHLLLLRWCQHPLPAV